MAAMVPQNARVAWRQKAHQRHLQQARVKPWLAIDLREGVLRGVEGLLADLRMDLVGDGAPAQLVLPVAF